MKQKDIALIVLIIAFSGIVSYFVSTQIFVTSDSRQQKVQTADIIDSSFQKPSEKYFNNDSINPSQIVQISGNDNQNPFNTKR